MALSRPSRQLNLPWSLALLLFVPAAGAEFPLIRGEPRVPEPRGALQEVAWTKQNDLERCHNVTQCYCIRKITEDMNNICGWCETLHKALLGDESGPYDEEGHCGRWIFWHQDCPTLKCDEDWTLTWYVELIMPLVLFGLLYGWARRSYTQAPPRPASKPAFTKRRWKLEEFRKGLWGDRAKMHDEPFQLYAAYSSGIATLIESLRTGTTLHRVFGQSMKFGFGTALFYTVLRIAPVYSDREGYTVISATLLEVQRLSQILKVSVGFLFSFYALGRVGWWWKIMEIARSLQGRSHDLAMLVGGVTAVRLHPGNGEDGASAAQSNSWMDSKWNFFRYELLVFILCFRPISADFGEITFEDLEGMGLLEPQEAMVLKKSIHPRKVVLKWLAIWIEYYVEDMTVRALLMDKLCGMRGACGYLHDTVEQRAPMSFESLMYATVTMWILTIPFGRLSDVDDRRVVIQSSVLIPTISAVVSCSFYLSILALLEAFKEPFGLGIDAMNAEVILLETETSIYDFLVSPLPESLAAVGMEKIPCGEDAGCRARPRGASQLGMAPMEVSIANVLSR